MPLEIDVDKKLNLDLQRDIVGRRIAVLGVSGQGKTNTAAVLVEELLTAGLPLTIVDIEGEYWGLKEKYEILVAGSGEHTDFPAGPGQAAALAELSVAESIPVILDLSDFTASEQADFLLAYFGSLWTAVSKKRTPYEVIIEEAHEFIPEGVRTPLKEMLTRLALRGRKRGLGAIIMSQRTANVAKSFLTQAEMLFLHRVVHPTDLRVYKDLIPAAGKEVEEMVGQLRPGQVVYVYNHQAALAQIRPRHTFHAGATPQLDAQVATRLKTIDKGLLDKLAQVAKASTGSPGLGSSGTGTGQVAQGVEFANGKCAVSFISGPVSSVIAYDSFEDVMAIHCHGGATELILVEERAAAIAEVAQLKAFADAHATGKKEGFKEIIEFLKTAGFDSTESEIDELIRTFKDFLVKSATSNFLEGGPDGFKESGRRWINS